MKKFINCVPHTLRQMLAPALCVLFIGGLTLSVRGQMVSTGVAVEHKGLFLCFMLATMACVCALSVWSILSNANLTGTICSLGILLAVASCYQVLFRYNSFCLHVLLGAAAAVTVYHVWRRMNELPEKCFYALAIICVVSMTALMLFGTVENGARLSIDFKLFQLRPGEMVKIFSMVLGACSSLDPRRRATYCASTLYCCFCFLKCSDLGGAVLLFATFVVMTYLLFDNRILSIGIIVGAAAALLFLLFFTDYAVYARSRILNLFHAMTNETDVQQHHFIRAALLGGFGGLGLENSHIMTTVYAARHDGALAGVMAVYGVPMILVVMAAYALLAIAPAYNRSVYPAGYLLLAQMTVFVVCHSLLNYCGGLDSLPFTGIVSPIISAGGTAMLWFGVLMGLSAAAMHPSPRVFKEV